MRVNLPAQEHQLRPDVGHHNSLIRARVALHAKLSWQLPPAVQKLLDLIRSTLGHDAIEESGTDRLHLGGTREGALRVLSQLQLQRLRLGEAVAHGDPADPVRAFLAKARWPVKLNRPFTHRCSYPSQGSSASFAADSSPPSAFDGAAV